MIGAAAELGQCQVRSGTYNPCTYPAAVKIGGVPFCERCAREQEAYFAIGELTQDVEKDERAPWWPSHTLLVEALRRLRKGTVQRAAEEPEARLKVAGGAHTP